MTGFTVYWQVTVALHDGGSSHDRFTVYRRLLVPYMMEGPLMTGFTVYWQVTVALHDGGSSHDRFYCILTGYWCPT